MKNPFPVKKKNVITSIIVCVILFYFLAIVFFGIKGETPVFFFSLFQDSSFRFAIFFLTSAMAFLVLYNIAQIIYDRAKKREGSKLRLRLTLLFLLVTSIPFIAISVIANNWISNIVNVFFLQNLENSLVGAMGVSREFYKQYAEESLDEWREVHKNPSLDDMGGYLFQKIDGVFLLDNEHRIRTEVYSNSTDLKGKLRDVDKEALAPKDWKRVMIHDDEYLLIPAETHGAESLLLVRHVPSSITMYTSSISEGIQQFRTAKLMREKLKTYVILSFIIITMPFVLLSFYLGFVISRDVTLPIRELVIATQKVSRDDLDYRVELEAKDELKQLIDSFNRMTDDLRINQELLKHSERSAAWRDIARKIAHEIKNPLTPIRLSAERILRQYEKYDTYRGILTKGIDTILTEVQNITDMVNEFSSFAQFPSSKLERHDIIRFLDDIFEFLKDTYKNIEFSMSHGKKSVYLTYDRYQLRRAILNIVYNSIDAVGSSGKIWIEGYTSSGKKDHYTIAISDNGSGIGDDIKGKIFDPYFSKNGTGAGLGLTIVERIVLDNNGRIWFESRPGKTTFYLEFEKA
jgi:two-component system nitrogen regulation sensor histidine kinase NtrY